MLAIAMWCHHVILTRIYRCDFTSKMQNVVATIFPVAHHTSAYWLCSLKIIQFQDQVLNSSLPGQNGRHIVDNIFICIFVNENFCILIKISLKFVRKGPIDNNPAFV